MGVGGCRLPRGWFLAGVTAYLLAGLLLVPLSGSADTACTVSSDVATCTGDQSGGIKNGSSFSSDIISLNVNNLTTAIGPTLAYTNSGGSPAGVILEYSGVDRNNSQTINFTYDASNSTGSGASVQASTANAVGFYIQNSGSNGSDSHAGKDAYWTTINVTSLNTMSLTASTVTGIYSSAYGGNGVEGPTDGPGGAGGGGHQPAAALP